jgi:hypothetical protein
VLTTEERSKAWDEVVPLHTMMKEGRGIANRIETFIPLSSFVVNFVLGGGREMHLLITIFIIVISAPISLRCLVYLFLTQFLV